MNYEYYLTLDAKQGVLGLTDLFKEERLMEIFELVHTKLVARRTEPQDETTWNTNADIDTPATGDAMRRAGQVEEFQGKWYPRPARTACGYVFTYAPYEKDCYAAGTIHILLTPEEVEGMTK